MFIEHLAGFSEDQAYRVMDLLLDAQGEIASEVFSSVARLLNQDIVFAPPDESMVAEASWPRP